MVLVSPWIDMALKAHQGGNPAVESDYFLVANEAIPGLVRLFIGDRSPESPEVNSLFRQPDELQGLSPQLIFTGGAEFARQDSEQWAELCQRAGLKYRLVIEWAQLHIYAMGSNFTDRAVRRKTDDLIIEWIKDHVGQ
jgi:acetyl esterase/lipase